MSGDTENVISWNLPEFLEACDPEKRLTLYYKLLAKENQRVNLVSRETLPPLPADSGTPGSFVGVEKLSAESLAPVHTLKQRSFRQYLDIGSGGGFPALPLMLTCDMQFSTLIERTQKKAAALRRMLVNLDLRAEIMEDTFENLTFASGKYDLVTLRLVKLTDMMFTRIIDLLAPQGVFIYYANPSFVPDTADIKHHTVRYSFDGGEVHCATFFYRINS